MLAVIHPAWEFEFGGGVRDEGVNIISMAASIAPRLDEEEEKRSWHCEIQRESMRLWVLGNPVSWLLKT